MIDHYAVFGHPVKQSLSPLIHHFFAQSVACEIIYDKRDIEPGLFEQAVRAFFSEGGKGLNITVPFKETAFALAKKVTQRAQLAQAVNTLYLNAQNEVEGDNTDGVGFMRDIYQNHHCDFKNKNVVILGAGGAVRGILAPMLEKQPANVYVVNRTHEKAQGLAAYFSAHFPNVFALDSRECEQMFSEDKVDFLINGTSMGVSNQNIAIPFSTLSAHTFCYDLVYGKEQTPFLKMAEKLGAVQLCDGLGMLVEQAAEAFFVWRNVLPKTLPAIEMIKKL